MPSYVKKKGGWTARIRLAGRSPLTESGFRTKQEAKDWALERESAMRQSPKMKGVGPHHTTLAEGHHAPPELVRRMTDEGRSVVNDDEGPAAPSGKATSPDLGG